MIGKLKCLLGLHKWERSRFVALGTPLGEYAVYCDRCGKCEHRTVGRRK